MLLGIVRVGSGKSWRGRSFGASILPHAVLLRGRLAGAFGRRCWEGLVVEGGRRAVVEEGCVVPSARAVGLRGRAAWHGGGGGGGRELLSRCLGWDPSDVSMGRVG